MALVTASTGGIGLATASGLAVAGTAEGCETLVERLSAPDIVATILGIYEPKDFFESPDED